MRTNEDIWIYAEHHNGKIATVVQELIDKSIELKYEKNSGNICLILMGENIEDLAIELKNSGCDYIYEISHTLLRDYDTNIYTKVIADMMGVEMPEIMLFGATYEGRDLAPRLAARLHTGLTADCVALGVEQDTGCLKQIVPGFGGKMFSTIVCPAQRPQMATVRAGALEFNKKITEVKNTVAEIKKIIPDISESDKLTRIIGIENTESLTADLKEARIICAGGLGLKTKENFELLNRFAKAIGAGIGATRAATDEGLCDEKYMIGQTGSIVSPDIYFAFGISGSIQHIIGIRNCKCMIAINEDYLAPIFEIADYAIVGDAKAVLENMLARKDEILKMLEATLTGAG